MGRILIGSAGEVQVGKGLPTPLLPPRPARLRAAVLTQPGARHIADRVRESLKGEGLDTTLVELPDRDDAKSLRSIEEVYHLLADFELGRDDTVVAVGGGSVTDAGGFVAATWMRGVELVNVPTTLLGAVDAAIGGKTAINLAGKNLVGAFWHPRRVVVDLETLAALPVPLKREGAAEIIKAGMLAAPRILDIYLEQGVEADLDEIVPAAIEVKAEIVAEDFTERGRRALLNLGHTIGHGVEYATGLTHGEAVAIGLVAAAAVSERRCGFEETPKAVAVLEAVGLPTRAPAVDRDRVLALIRFDKKRTGRGQRMVLLEAFGRPVLADVDDADLHLGLEAVGL